MRSLALVTPFFLFLAPLGCTAEVAPVPQGSNDAEGDSAPEQGSDETIDEQSPASVDDPATSLPPDSDAPCSGAWGTPVEVVSADRIPSSPAITGDGLELFFVAGALEQEQFYSVKRANRAEDFGEAAPVPALNAECTFSSIKTIEVSNDGLRIYLSCSPDLQSDGVLTMMTRASRDSTFGSPSVVGATPLSPWLSDDQLSLFYASTEAKSATFMATRGSIDEKFGAPSEVPGLETAALSAPTLSPDGLEIYGFRRADNTLVRAKRTSIDAAFGIPTEAVDLTSIGGTGAPDLTTDCRSVLMMGYLNEGRGSGILESRR